MSHTPQVVGGNHTDSPETSPPSEPCIMLIFGASGDLTKRLLVPALYNLACDGLLSPNFAVLGTANEPLTHEQFRERMTQNISKFHTRNQFDQPVSPTSTSIRSSSNKSPSWMRNTTRTATSSSTSPLPRASSAPSAKTSQRPASRKAPAGNASSSRSPSARTSTPRSSSIATSSRTGTSGRSTASIITWARKQCRTSSPSASATACSSRSGTRTTSTTSSSTSPKPSMSNRAAAITISQVSCAT